MAKKGDGVFVSNCPELLKYWDTTENEKMGMVPCSELVTSKKEAFWVCENGHHFCCKIYPFSRRKIKCRICAGRDVLPGLNDLETLFPEIANEWDDERNGQKKPNQISPFSYTSYYWICPKGHSYKKKVIQRTRFHKQIDCSKCVKAYSTSFPEQAIFFYVKKCFPDAINRYKDPFEKGMELDIFIPEYRIGIEYDGEAFHKTDEQHKREQRKYQECQKLGITLVRIKESKDSWNDTSDSTFFVKKRMKDREFQSFLSFLFGCLFQFSAHLFKTNNKIDAYLNNCYGFPTDFNVERDRAEILEYLVDIDHSFGSLHQEQASLWSREKNGNLTPFMFTPGSNYEPTWECPKCGKTWKSPIGSMVKRKVTCCRECSIKNNGAKITNAKAIRHGSLASKNKRLLDEWDFEKNNPLSPYEIPESYSFKVSWKCRICGHQWMSSPNSRVRKHGVSSCPHCAGRVPIPGLDDLQTLYPKIASEWDRDLNVGKDPSEIRPYSNKAVYWKCKKHGISYLATPANRVSGSGCPKCGRERTKEKTSKKVEQYTKELSFVATFPSINDAGRALKTSPEAIRQAAIKGCLSSGFYWKYEGTDFGLLKPDKKHSIVATNIKTGEETNFESARQAERITGVGHSRIMKCCKEAANYKSAGGFYWRFQNADKKDS